MIGYGDLYENAEVRGRIDGFSSSREQNHCVGWSSGALREGQTDVLQCRLLTLSDRPHSLTLVVFFRLASRLSHSLEVA